MHCCMQRLHVSPTKQFARPDGNTNAIMELHTWLGLIDTRAPASFSTEALEPAFATGLVDAEQQADTSAVCDRALYIMAVAAKELVATGAAAPRQKLHSATCDWAHNS